MRFFPLLLVLLFALSARAQTRYEGTLTQTQNGLSATAQLSVETPDRIRIEIKRDDAAGVPAQIIVATGDQTLQWLPATKQLIRAPFNVLKKWNRGWGLAAGGPANFVFAGANAGVTTETEGRFSRRDKVLFGGGGEGAYYAATKIADGLYPARVELSGAPISKRVETSVAGAAIMTANPTYAGALPTTVTVSARGENSTFRYDLKTRADAFPAGTFSIPEASAALAQEANLRAPTAYGNSQDPNDLLNQGLALWRGGGDFPGALARLAAASQIAPQASAPRLAAFEMAMQTRQLANAQAALDALAPLGLDAAEIETRRARLAALKRDWDGALSSLDKALASAPDSYVLKLARAQVLLGKGDVEGARAMWKDVVSAPVPPLARAEAATLWVRSYAGERPPRMIDGRDNGNMGGKYFPPPDDESAKFEKIIQNVRLEDALDAPFPAGTTNQFGAFARTFLQSDVGRAALAVAYERDGHDDKARELWELLEKSASDDTRNQARAHLMVLAARRGDVNASLDEFETLQSALPTQTARDEATRALFDGWQKAFRRDALGAAIVSRAGATRAGEAEARLLLAYQDAYGDDAARADAVENGLSRAPDAPFWLGRRAEILASAASVQSLATNASAARRDALLAQVRALLQRAIDNDKKSGGDGLFYAQQRALILAQGAARFNSPGSVSDAGRAVSERRAAGEALDALVNMAPADPDNLLSAALAWQSFGGDEGAKKAIELAGRALLTDPNDGSRHTPILAARQSLAVAYERLKQPVAAAGQYQLLLLEADDAGEEAGIAANYLGFLGRANDAAGMAGVMARIAGEPWNYSEARASLEALAARVAVSPLVASVEADLAKNNGDAAKLAWGHIALARLSAANAALQQPGAPGSADADKTRAERDLSAATAALGATNGSDTVGARIAAWLAENGGLSSDASLAQLKRAVAIEARAPALRLALVDALPDDEAKVELAKAAPVTPDDAETLRRLSLAKLDLGDNAGAVAGSEGAFNRAARDPLVRTNTFQRIAFARAKIAWVMGDTARAIEIYNGLALPQWAPLDRAAALLALREKYLGAERADDAAKVDPKLAALGLTDAQLQGAAAFVEDVEN